MATFVVNDERQEKRRRTTRLNAMIAQQNHDKILACILDGPPKSAVQISRVTGLSLPVVRGHVEHMIKRGECGGGKTKGDKTVFYGKVEEMKAWLPKSEPRKMTSFKILTTVSKDRRETVDQEGAIKNLMTAVVSVAVEQLRHAISHGDMQQEREVHAWLKDKNDRQPFSFAAICRETDLDQDWFNEALERKGR